MYDHTYKQNVNKIFPSFWNLFELFIYFRLCYVVRQIDEDHSSQLNPGLRLVLYVCAHLANEADPGTEFSSVNQTWNEWDNLVTRAFRLLFSAAVFLFAFYILAPL